MAHKRPNILLVVIDCLRADRTLGPGRSAYIPTVRALARRGAAFSHMITVNSMTIPCMTSLFSGLYPVHSGVRSLRGRRIADGIPLLAEILQASGYHTCAEPTSPLGSHLKLNQGFDQYNLRKGEESPFVGEWGAQFLGRFEKQEFAEPWFVYLHLWELHQPRHVLPQYDQPEYGATAYDRAMSGVDLRLGQLLDAVNGNTLIFLTSDHGERIPTSSLEGQLEQQKALVKRLLSRILPVRGHRALVTGAARSLHGAARSLRRRGLLRSSLTTPTGHGYHVYDSLVRVPLIVAGPGVPQREGVIDKQVRQIDIFPTILDLVDLAGRIPGTIDGRSLVPLMRGEKLSPLPAYVESWSNDADRPLFFGARTADWKYIYDPARPSHDMELYDLRSDPDERVDVSATHPDVVAEMKSLAREHFHGEPGRQVGTEMTQEELVDLTEQLKGLGYLE